MKKTIFSLFALTIGASAFAQSAQEQAIKDNDIKQASVTVFPEKQWCIQRGYVLDNGAPDYDKALLNSDALNFVNALEGAATDNGYEFENFSAKLDNNQNIEAFNLVNEIAQFDTEEILSCMSLATYSITYSIDQNASGLYEIRLKALDTATEKVWFARTYTTDNLIDWKNNPINTEIINELFSKINNRYSKMLKEGRDCLFFVLIKEGCKLNFFDNIQFNNMPGKLNELIDLWLSRNAVSTNYRRPKSFENLILFRDVKIPVKRTRNSFGFGTKYDGIELTQFFEGSADPNGLGGLDDVLATLDLSLAIYPVGINGGILVIDNKY